ncbi:MAG TPA: pilus assembly protein TadG-related protein [Pseudolabrys sp.]|jgi:Flp pilus assembly protein TadG
MKAIFKALKDSGRRFARHGRGNVVLTFALAVTPIVLSVGAAVDYSMANRTKAELDAIADAAALLAVNQQALSLTPSGAKSEAQKMFKAQTAKIARLNSSKVTATVTDTTSGRTAVVDYTAVVPNAFMGVIGVNTTTLKGEATAATPIPTYIDFYLLLDNTPSMGVGATTADIAKMVNNTPDQCAFACHDVTNANSYYNLAQSLGVTTRIDVMRLATQQLMDTASSAEIVSSQYRMAIYTFGASATTAGLTAITPLTSNLSSAKSDAANIDLMAVSGQGQNNDQDTDFDTVLPAINNLIPNPGNGTSSGSPQKYLFFVSDGVADENNSSSCSQPTTAGRCQEPIDVSLCTAIKKRGIKIAVLYTTYLDLPTNAWYNTWIAPFNAGPYGPSINSKIAANMQACATPGFYFEVSPTAGIPDAMNALFQKVVAQARLTK